MLRTDCVYRVLFGFEHCYAVSPDGEGVYWYNSMKQVNRAHGEGFGPLVIKTEAEFDALRAA